MYCWPSRSHAAGRVFSPTHSNPAGWRPRWGVLNPDFLCSLVESRSLVRLSVKKAAYADLSRAASRKSGGGTRRYGRRTPDPGVACGQPGSRRNGLGQVFLSYAAAHTEPRRTRCGPTKRTARSLQASFRSRNARGTVTVKSMTRWKSWPYHGPQAVIHRPSYPSGAGQPPKNCPGRRCRH
jgi:hypothetical protein